jgi:hypothetical protein
LQGVEIGSQHGKQPSEVDLVAGWVLVEFDLGQLGPDELANLEPTLAPPSHVPKQIRVKSELNLVSDRQRLAAPSNDFEVYDPGAIIAGQHEVEGANERQPQVLARIWIDQRCLPEGFYSQRLWLAVTHAMQIRGYQGAGLLAQRPLLICRSEPDALRAEEPAPQLLGAPGNRPRVRNGTFLAAAVKLGQPSMDALTQQ